MSIEDRLKESVLCYLGSSFEKKSYSRTLQDLGANPCSLRHILGKLLDEGSISAKLSNVSGKRLWLYYTNNK